MKNFFDILKSVSNYKLGDVDPNPETFGDVWEDVKNAVKLANSFIWNFQNYPFRLSDVNFTTTKNVNLYQSPFGVINIVLINNEPISFIENKRANEYAQAGKPKFYAIETLNTRNYIKLSPTPDEIYNVSCKYFTFNSVLDGLGAPKLNFTQEEDALNINPEYEDIYLKCLEMKSMEFLIKDPTAQILQTFIKAFNENFETLRALTSDSTPKRIII
jgi:hypothetical protein